MLVPVPEDRAPALVDLVGTSIVAAAVLTCLSQAIKRLAGLGVLEEGQRQHIGARDGGVLHHPVR